LYSSLFLHDSLTRLSPIPTPFPYTTLFRSRATPPAESRFEQPGFSVLPPQLWPSSSPIREHRHPLFPDAPCARRSVSTFQRCRRSEEHTSELQSRGHLVCRLLLEKKNNHVS